MVRDNLETFLTEQRADGRVIPRFVADELRRYLTCGILARGFVRVRCEACGKEDLVAFSCKGRGFCPSCCGRRMTETAIHLVERVLPPAPYRQWVMAYPWPVRLALARDRIAGTRSQKILIEEIFRWQRRVARSLDVRKGRPGAVACTQRFGSKLNLNVHHHAIVPDGVFVDGGARARFEALPGPTPEDLRTILERIVVRTKALLKARGLDELEAQGPLDEIQAEAVQVPMGFAAAPEPRRCEASLEGYSLEAGSHVHENDRVGLEHLCRYLLRPPLSLKRLTPTGDGRVTLALRRMMPDGTIAIAFTPRNLLRRLAALVPPPRAHMVRYHGVFAPACKLRLKVVPAAPESEAPAEGCGHEPGPKPPAAGGGAEPVGKKRYIPWAELLQRTFGTDVLTCACGGRRRVIAYIPDGGVAGKILEHLGLDATGPPLAPAKAPPWQEELDLPEDSYDGVDEQYPDDGAQAPAPEME